MDNVPAVESPRWELPWTKSLRINIRGENPSVLAVRKHHSGISMDNVSAVEPAVGITQDRVPAVRISAVEFTMDNVSAVENQRWEQP